jgi:hypothetical protein
MTCPGLVGGEHLTIRSLRSALREFFPAALDAFDDLAASDTLEILGRGPDPDRAARLSRAQIIGPLRRANRRDIDARATRLQEQSCGLRSCRSQRGNGGRATAVRFKAAVSASSGTATPVML